MLLVSIALVLCVIPLVYSEENVVAKAIQIISPIDHAFQLEADELKRILETDDIKDRHITVVSVAGAFRKGKSFLMNFFLKYLYAQVKLIK